MDARDLERRMTALLHELTAFPDRHVGGPGNHAATETFVEAVTAAGFEVRRTPFSCFEWEHGEASVVVGGERFALEVGPFSLPASASGPLVVVHTAEELEAVSTPGGVLLLIGEIAKGQVMPKNFTFYNPESHKRIVRALEAAMPLAVIAATGTDPGMVGSQYPFPLFEDGDLDVPNAYMRDVDGERLSRHAGAPAEIRIDSRRVAAGAEHVVATRSGDRPGRIVLFAHIDSRVGSPGALDNGSGVAALIGAAELLAGHRHGPTLEIVPLNGEDDYANPGELIWVGENEGRFEEIVVGLNVDDAGLAGFDTHVSFYGCPEPMRSLVLDVARRFDDIAEGPQWFQSDHAILGLYRVPAIALTSAGMQEFMERYAHSERDTVELADAAVIADVARFLAATVEALSGD